MMTVDVQNHNRAEEKKIVPSLSYGIRHLIVKSRNWYCKRKKNRSDCNQQKIERPYPPYPAKIELLDIDILGLRLFLLQKVSDEKSAQNEEEIDCIGSVAKQTDVLQIKKPVFPAYGGTMVQQNQQCCKKSQGIYPQK